MLSMWDTGEALRRIEQGAMIELGGGSLTISPPTGWLVLNDGSGRSEPMVEIGDDEVVVSLSSRPFTGTADALMDEIMGACVAPDRVHGCCAGAMQYALRWSTGTDDEQLVAAVVFTSDHTVDRNPAIALEVVADGPAGTIVERLSVIVEMVASARPTRLALALT